MEKEKDFFSIGEISRKTNIPTHTLRYWEKENLIRSVRSGNSQRRYTAESIETIQEIKDLLHIKKLTIEGARKIINKPRHQRPEIFNVNMSNNETVPKDLKPELSNEICRTIQDTISLIDKILEKSEI